MKDKRLIDLKLTGDVREPPTTSYYGNTLVSLLGDSRPSKTSVRSFECSRLTPTSKPSSSRAASARSHVTSSSLSPGTANRATSAVNRCRPTSAFPNRLTSAVSRGTSAVSRVTGTSAVTRGTSGVSLGSSSRGRRRSHVTSSASSTIHGVFSGTSGSLSDLNLCQMGLTVWRLEKNALNQLSLKEHGFFHQGNCYVILMSDGDESYQLHVWYGSQSYKSDRDAVRLQAEELDRSLDGAAFMSIECEGHETPTFMSHFPDGIVIVEGKSKQQLGRATKYIKRLYVVKGRKYPSATCVECSASAATSDNVLILDGYPRMYVWMGENTGHVLRVKAITLARKMRTWQRNGKGHVIVLDKEDGHLNEIFLRKLDGEKPNETEPPETVQKDDVSDILQLYRINGERVLYDMPLVAKRPLQQKYLTTTDTFLLDQGASQPIYVWVGSGEDSDALYGALNSAHNFAQHNGYSSTTPLCRVMEGDEPVAFKTKFADWKDRAVKERQLVRSYNVANIGRALFSRSDRRTVAKLAEVWSDDEFVSGEGTTEMWQVDGENLIPLCCEQLGVFYNWLCYVFLYREDDQGVEQRVIYYWMGSKANKEDQEQAQKLALAMDSALNHTTAVMRVLDGKEPKHFLTVLQRSIIVYDADLRQDRHPADSVSDLKLNTNINMYSVREVATECMRVSQVPPLSSSLNSSAAYVVISDKAAFLWYGKNASAYEREYSKNMLAYFCPNRSYDYDILTEGRESVPFWTVVAYTGGHPQEFLKPKLERHSPTLTLCSNKSGTWSFSDVPDFSQEDLCESDIFILDTHDQIQLWSGAAVADREYKLLSKAIQTYIDLDSCGRDGDDLKIWYCNQRQEPSVFSKYFKGWDEHGFGGELAYQAARKRLRQENANINIDCQMIDITYTTTTKMTYKELAKGDNLPCDIDVNHKELHLSDKEFTRALRMARAQFYRLPEWKQQQILKSARLAAPSTTPTAEGLSSQYSPDADSFRLKL